MKKETNAEEILLSNTSLDELIKIKMEEEMRREVLAKKEKRAPRNITKISEVPKHLVFSRQAVYRIFNRNTGNETFINGIQAEALIGLQDSVREKIRAGKTDAFATDDAYVKFENIVL